MTPGLAETVCEVFAFLFHPPLCCKSRVWNPVCQTPENLQNSTARDQHDSTILSHMNKLSSSRHFMRQSSSAWPEEEHAERTMHMTHRQYFPVTTTTIWVACRHFKANNQLMVESMCEDIVWRRNTSECAFPTFVGPSACKLCSYQWVTFACWKRLACILVQR